MLVSLHSAITGCCIYFQFEVNKRWENSGQMVEHVNYPTCYITYRFGKLFIDRGCELAQGWFPDINTNAAANNIGFYTRQGYLIRNPDPKGSFQYAIPMRHTFYFLDDYSGLWDARYVAVDS